MPLDRLQAIPIGLRSSTGVLVGLLVLAVALSLFLGSVAAQEESRIADELIALTNVDRTSNGLAALSVDRRLVSLALERSADMIARDYFSHAIPPDGHTVFDLMASREIAYRAAGENLAFNTAPLHETARVAERELMNSPGHRALILHPDFDHLGVGVAIGREQRTVYTVLFAGFGGTGHDTLAPPLLGGVGEPPSPTSVPAAEPTPRAPSVSSEPLRGAMRLRLSSAQPLGLIEDLANRTLRLYLGL